MVPIHQISKIDSQLRVFSEIWAGALQNQYRLRMTLFYQGQSLGRLDFTLSGYNEPDVALLAHNIPNNSFLMQEIDEYLNSGFE